MATIAYSRKNSLNLLMSEVVSPLMKIPDSRGGEVDTNNMTDAEAEVFAAVDNLYKICKKYNLTFVSRTVLGGGKFAGGQFIADIKNEEDRFKNLIDLYFSLDQFVREGTNNMVRVSFDNPTDKA